MTDTADNKIITKTEKEFVADLESLIAQKKYAQAHVLLDKLFAAGADSAALFHLKGVTHSFEKNFDQALFWIQKAINKRGDYWLFMKNMGLIQRDIGNLEEAHSYFVKALEAKKNNYETYRYLSEVKKYTHRPTFLTTVEKMLVQQNIKASDKAHLHFAAGKIYDDLKDYDSAFEHYKKGNAAFGHLDNMTLAEGKTEDFISTYSKEYLNSNREKGIEDAQPVFIVGMPRSGTSLMEQLIASHPMGHGVGELPIIGRIASTLDTRYKKEGGWPKGVAFIKGDWRKGFGRSYLDHIKECSSIDDPNARVVDKQPFNLWYIGMIYEMFPNAKIIHMKRDARDTCLSCYFQHFVISLDFSSNLKQLGSYYRLYERMMAHWQKVLPDAFITVEYENLVENFETEARRVIDYIGLPWDDACLSPHKAKHVMQTASAWQVRQPIYTSSKKRWQKYEKHLGPLLKSLEAHK